MTQKLTEQEFLEKNFGHTQGKGAQLAEHFLAEVKDMNPPCEGQAEKRLTPYNAESMLRDAAELVGAVSSFFGLTQPEQVLAVGNLLVKHATPAVLASNEMRRALDQAIAEGSVEKDAPVVLGLDKMLKELRGLH